MFHFFFSNILQLFYRTLDAGVVHPRSPFGGRGTADDSGGRLSRSVGDQGGDGHELARASAAVDLHAVRPAAHGSRAAVRVKTISPPLCSWQRSDGNNVNRFIGRR